MTFTVCTPKPYPPCTCETRYVGACCLDCDGVVDDMGLRAQVAELAARLRFVQHAVDNIDKYETDTTFSAVRDIEEMLDSDAVPTVPAQSEDGGERQ